MSNYPIFENLKERLSRFPSLHYSIEGNSFLIDQPNESGFPIGLYIDSSEFTVRFGDWHGHFDSEDEVINFIGFGLSSSCRLRVICRGGKPYKWIVESKDGSGWRREYILGLFSWNFWSKQSEVISQNNVFPAA